MSLTTATVCSTQDEYQPDWQLLLDAALHQEGSAGQTGVDALLDGGALLAGIETRYTHVVTAVL